MTHFLLQHRHLRRLGQAQPSFPATLIARVKFGPEDAFGISGNDPRTTAKQGATPAGVYWSANEGVSLWDGPLIDQLKAEFQEGDLSGQWAGNQLLLKVNVKSLEDANHVVSSANQLVPAFLSLRLRVFVWIKEFLVEIGDCPFRLETSQHHYGITIASTKHNEECAKRSIRDWKLQGQESLRVVMAIYYYRQALRLATLEPDRQSMAAEVILNLAKAIEIIFSCDRNRLRSKAKKWGLDLDSLERWIIPILLIRNEFDVAHGASAPLSSTQHEAILRFLIRALTHVHKFLEDFVEMVQAGKIVLDPPSASMAAAKERLLNKIEEYAALK